MNSNSITFFDEQPVFILDQCSGDILDVNDSAEECYGYSHGEFTSMNIDDLGTEKNRAEILGISSKGSTTEDKLHVHKTKQGKDRFVKFTSHSFNCNEMDAKLVVAHDVSYQIEEEKRRLSFPDIVGAKSNFPFAEIRWGSDLEIDSWSRQSSELFGWSEKEIKNMEMNINDFLIEEAHLIQSNLHEVIESKESHFSFETKVKTRKGESLICKWYNSLRYNKQGDLKYIHSLIVDVSDQRQSENLFRALSEESLVGVYLIQDGVFKYVNPRFSNIFGYEREDIIGMMSPFDLTHPEDVDLVKENLRRRIEGEEDSIEYEFRCTTKTDDVIDVSVYGARITYMGRPAVVGTLLDITENKETVRKYEASLNTFQDLFDSISDAIYIQDKDGRFLEVNQGAVDMYGYDESFFIGQTPEVLAAPGKVDLEETKKKVQKAINGTPQSFEWWGKRKNGEVFPKEVVVNPGTYFGEDAVITIARDITERYKAEEELRKNEEMFRQLFQNAPVPIALLDKRQEVRKVNDSFDNTFGYQTDEVRGLNIDNFLVPEDEREAARKVSNKIFSGETAFHTGKRVCKDGSLVDVLIYGVPVNVGEKTVAIFGIFVDITDRKKAEEKVKKSLKEKEVLLAEIHHRVKNNLAVITGLLELQAFNTTSEEATEVLTASQMRINSIALIHEKLYQNKNLSEISFDTYLQELTDVIVSSMKSEETDVSISIDADPIDFTISQAIPCGLILNELITNAYKHAFVNQEKGKININISNKDGQIYMTVKDNGIGISEEVSLDNPQSLGIKLIHTLSTQLEGESEFNRTGEGTEFTLQFKLKK
ncbi:PAS domain S-box protein [Fodinibius halophilus]|uniref:PAS domain S-box protein n=1 Tax=Fodinibius halophilus TaxID=1736908 RepID=A0A6M1TA01_9BACT|nr:PAS domain S-box protein [Fodinibius halophilus]NGP88861.1 PAS domain S-box protein [Fodinibius halophilus]